jgi:L-asparaginase
MKSCFTVCNFMAEKLTNFLTASISRSFSQRMPNFPAGTVYMAIRIFITGGTFDKEYNELNGELFFKDTHLHEMLRLGRSKLKLDITTLMMIDSLDMTDADRGRISHECTHATEERILITHGTDTMAITASVLAEKVKDKTIVITGAMVPYKFGSSDGMFNLGSALAFVQTLPHGVYIAMNGKIFEGKNVRKNKSTGEFEIIHQ